MDVTQQSKPLDSDVSDSNQSQCFDRLVHLFG